MSYLFILNTITLYLLVSIAPFIWLPKVITIYEVPKVYWTLLMIGWWAILTSIRFIQQKRFHRDVRVSPLLYLTGLYIVVLWFSSIYNNDLLKSFLGNYYRADGLLTMTGLYCFSLLVAVNKKHISPYFLSICLVATASLLSLWSLLERVYFFAGGIHLWPEPTAISFGNANFLAGYLVVCLPFVWYLWQNKTSSLARKVIATVTVLIISAIGASESFGAIACLFVLLVMAVLRDRPIKTWFIAMLAGIIAISSFFYWKELRPNDYNPESRGRIFSSLLVAAAQKPIIGWGVGRVDDAFATVRHETILHDIYIDKAHSHFLEILVTSGGVGLSVYLFVYLLTFKRLLAKSQAVRSNNSYLASWYVTLAVTLVIFGLHTQTNVISINEELLFWLILGYAYQA